MVELIIAEKPDAAKNIAAALADGKPKKSAINGVAYHELTHKGKAIIICSAVGHLFTVAGKEKSWDYPQFNIEWVETSDVDKKAAYTKKYVAAIKKLAKEAKEFTVATDFDIEGEVIGYNVIKFLCKQKDASRMMFSTLTKPDIVEAYENKQKTIDWGQAMAGVTRHELDWYYGINLSSALTSAIKAAGAFKVLSSGRVQGPALKMLCDREKEIQAFKPEPYWMIQMLGNVKLDPIEAWHILDKIFDEKKADAIMSATKGKPANVKSVDISEMTVQPPYPFDLTSFQVECYRVHKISPKESLSIAQELYIAGIISYPRTSSQKLPAKIGYLKILAELQNQSTYNDLAKKLLSKKSIKPNEGPKTDEAHPAIFPTGIVPEFHKPKQQKVYDLIVRRFLATFADPAIRETVKAIIDVNSEDFVCKGITTKYKGWHSFYGEYANVDEILLPPMKKGDKIDVKSIDKLAKETKPPKRYTPASIIKELDKRNLGTKATRAQIVDNLYLRGYVNNKSMEVTDIGLKTCDILFKYSPMILDEELTRKFEEELDKIRHRQMKPEQVLKEAQEVLTDLLADFRKKEKQVGEELKAAEYGNYEGIGKCPVCNKGELKVRKGKFGYFIGCDAYPDCKTILPLPRGARVKPLGEICPACNFPKAKLLFTRKSEDVCLNPNCPAKKDAPKEKYPEEGMTCPACKEGKMILRKSFYGSFLGCDAYPKCKTMMKIVKGVVNTAHITKNGATDKKTTSDKKSPSKPKSKKSSKKSTNSKQQII